MEPDSFLLNVLSFSQVLSLQHSGSDSSHSQFASYWKPILSMDANFWQRWLHMHRIVLLLEHDTYVTCRAELTCTVQTSLRKQGFQFSPDVELQLSFRCLWPRKGPCKWDLVDGEGSSLYKSRAFLRSVNFLQSFLGLDFLIAWSMNHLVRAVPHTFICCWQTSPPEAFLC